jgi:signal transduction histidine kinase
VPALLEIATLATRLDNADEALPLILRLIANELSAPAGAISLINPDSGRLELEAYVGPTPEGQTPSGPAQGLPGWSALHGNPVLSRDTRLDNRYRALTLGVLCQMAAPLRTADGDVLGVVSLDASHPGAFGEAELDQLVVLADEAGRVLKRLWDLDHLRAKAGQLETLLATGQTLVSKVEEKELFTALTRHASQLFQGAQAALYLHSPGSETVRVASFTAAAPGAPAFPEVPIDGSLVSSALRTRKTVAFLDIQAKDYYDLTDVPRGLPLHAALVSPLLSEQEPLGALVIFLDRIHRFDNDEKRLGAALASLGAVAIQNARLYARVFLSEESLRKNERLTTLGLLAAEIAHEIRNPLTVLKLLHGGLGLDFPEGDPRRTDLRVIAEKLDQLEAIVSRVLNFGHAPESLHTRVSLSDIVEDTLVLMRLKLAQNKITVHFDGPARPLIVDAHKGQLHQALLNLLLNAMQAMPDGGSIVVSARASVRGGHPAAVLEVADTGGGVPDAIRSRIFDSFLSGRPGGTGLGLAVVKRVVQSHHGDIELVSSAESGATFRITLPLVKG